MQVDWDGGTIPYFDSIIGKGYKACVSLPKLGKGYEKKRGEESCEHILTFSSSLSIRTITTLLKTAADLTNLLHQAITVTSVVSSEALPIGERR